jgi:type I restriction enzyme M protein
LRATQWCVQQGIASDDGFETAARQIVYRLVGQILFYQTLSRVRSDLDPIVIEINATPKALQMKLDSHFEAVRKIDYLAVFKEDYPDGLKLNPPITDTLIRFCNSFAALDLPKMGPDIIGRIFEALIPADEKKNLGQYFTEPWLGDLLVTGAARSKDDLILDPACGTGAILLRGYVFLHHLGKTKHGDLLDALWGNDIADFPIELAMINLFRLAPADLANFPRVHKGDLFDLKPGMEIEVPPNKPGGGVQKITLKFPMFDAIVGNPPYVRYQTIGAGASDPDRYRESLFGQFAYLDSTSDIFAFVFAHSATLLKAGGRLAFVTSNSWLGAEYGLKLKRFFLQNFKIIAILESRCEPWFENARVNTVVTVLEKSPSFGANVSHFLHSDVKEHKAAFVKLKKPINQLVTNNLSDPLRFDKYLRLWTEIDQAQDGLDNSTMRIRKRRQQILFDDLMEEFS